MTVTRGLEGIVATTSSISSIIDDTLTYVGYNIDDLAENASFEEVIYLLWHRKLPNSEQLAELKQQLAESAALPQEVIEHFKLFPVQTVHPMA
ncbi:citrate/2-methylcitrate synthase, partial [Neobacillus citreus]